jgi:hypothetical protein
MTDKEMLFKIIKGHGHCYGISCINCPLNTQATTLYQNIPCTWKVDRNTLDDEYKYENAIEKYVEMFGAEDILEILL